MSKLTFTNLIMKSGMSMSQIARDSGLSLSTISKIAAGTRKPSLATVVYLAGTMGVSKMEVIDAILGGENEKAA